MDIIIVILIGVGLAFIINYLADVLPIKRTLSKPICINCLSHHDWVWFLLMRRCPECDLKRGGRAWIVLIMVPLLLTWIWLRPPSRLGIVLGVLVMLYFLLVAIIDLEYRAILTQTSIFGVALAVIVGFIIRGLPETILGGAAGAGILLAIYFFGILFVKVLSKAKKTQIDEVAFGFGDVTLGGILGFMTGWPEVVGVIISAIFLAGIISAIILLFNLFSKKYQLGTAIPYAPFLILGAAIFLYIPK